MRKLATRRLVIDRHVEPEAIGQRPLQGQRVGVLFWLVRVLPKFGSFWALMSFCASRSASRTDMPLATIVRARADGSDVGMRARA